MEAKAKKAKHSIYSHCHYRSPAQTILVMNKKILVLSVLSILFFTFCKHKTNEMDVSPVTPQSLAGAIIPNQYLVMLNPSFIMPARERLDWSQIKNRTEKAAQMENLNAVVAAQLNNWLEEMGVSESQVISRYTALQVGAALNIDAATMERISRRPEVATIEHDRVETLPPFIIEEKNPPVGDAQTTPCGITNAGGSAAANVDRWIWIVDSGIDLDHPDLNVVTAAPYPATFVGGTADDCNGHGTHVAGTAGAINNTIGVIGVAAGAAVVPVRVFPCTGGSATSTIVSGINHVGTYDYPGDVCNMSLGGYYGTGCATGSGYLSAINALAAGGTRCAIASGNNNANAANYQPGCINGTNIFTVANMRCNKTWYNDPTYGSNYGRPPVDWIATGTSVYSTYLNGGYATLTGTSMATPHVAGIMQLRNAAPLSSGNVSYLGVNYPIAVR